MSSEKAAAATRSPGRFKVLIVDDSKPNQVLLKHCFQAVESPPELKQVFSGEDAISYLDQLIHTETFKTHDLLMLVLLDVHLPKLSGFDVLEWIRNNSVLHAVPVIMFSTSASSEQVSMAYKLKANSYLKKPENLEDMEETVRVIARFWLQMNRVVQNGT